MPSLYIFSALSSLVPLGAGLYFFRRLDIEMKILTIFFSFALIVEIIGFYLSFNRISYIWLIHLYTLLEYSLLMLIFSYWQKDNVLRRNLRLSIGFFAFIWIGAKMFMENLSYWDNYTASLESVLLVGVSAYTLFELSKENRTSLYKEPRFWVCGAVLVYFTGNLMVFALINIITIDWPIHSLLNIVANLFYTGGFLCSRHRLNYGGLLSSAL
jgi:hypothetical protein